MIAKANRNYALLFAALVVSALSAPSRAAGCDFSEIGGTLIDFGIHSAGERGSISGEKLVQFSCSNPLGLSTSYTASISTGSSGNYATRTLQFAGATINYNLYRDRQHTDIFGDGEVGTNTSVVSGVCVNNVTCVIPVFGLIEGGQQIQAGPFTDEVVMTLTF